MQSIVLEQIPFHLDLRVLSRELCVKERKSYFEDLSHLIREAQRIGKPKALYKLSFIEAKEDSHIVVDDVILRSRMLRVNLEEVHRVFPYVATCGTELEEWSNGIEDILMRYWAEEIKKAVLRMAIDFMERDILERFQAKMIACISPGSLEDWPIEEQRPLFSILGDTKGAIGVHLSECLFMIPTKSLSGIYFPTEVSFFTCQLCPREICPSRKATYDRALYEKNISIKRPSQEIGD
jgi:hypothetical protein